MSTDMDAGGGEDPDECEDCAELRPGDLVHDREHDVDPDEGVVVNTPPVPANEWDLPEIPPETVAEDNPEYDPEAPVVVVVFREELADARPDFAGDEQLPLAELDAPYYSFPRDRLEHVGHLEHPAGAQATPDELDVLEPLRDRLEGGATVEIDPTTDPTTLRVEKEQLGESYRVTPDGTVHGDGALAGRLRDVVEDVLGGEADA